MIVLTSRTGRSVEVGQCPGYRDAREVSLPGLQGILEMTEFGLGYTPQTGKDSAPSYYAGFPHARREAYGKKWHEENDPKLGQEPMPETVSYEGHDYDNMQPHLWTFFEAVRSRKRMVEDGLRAQRGPGLPHGE